MSDIVLVVGDADIENRDSGESAELEHHGEIKHFFAFICIK